MATNMFMKLGNLIEGEAEDVNHRNWCEIIEMKHEFTQEATAIEPGAQTVEDPKPEHGAVTISKYVDKATTEILKAVWEGTILPKVIIECLRADGSNKPVDYIKVELDNVIISEYKLKEFTGSSLPSEDLELIYKVVKYTYNKIDKKTGRSVGSKFASHNRETNIVS